MAEKYQRKALLRLDELEIIYLVVCDEARGHRRVYPRRDGGGTAVVSHTVRAAELVRRAALRDSRGQEVRIQAPSEGTYESELAAADVQRTILVAWGGVGTTFSHGIAVARASVAAEVTAYRQTNSLGQALHLVHSSLP